MSFKEGNQFWNKRSKHGRDRIISDPSVLIEASDEYFKWCTDNPIIQEDYKGKDATLVLIKHPRPFKKEEFARFCGLSQWRLIENLKDKSNDYLQVITHIERVIADQKYDYAVVGMFNANIIARDLGLAETQNINVDTKKELYKLFEDAEKV